MSTLLYFLVWGVLIVVMMRYGCGAHVMGHGHGSKHDADATGRGGAAGPTSSTRWVPPETDVDPVCGKTVATKDAKSNVHKGIVYYFCSAACREKFEASPNDFPADIPGKSAELEHHHA